MADLTVRLLGDLEVIRDGTPVTLPPSKKTRGLLAYLALHDRPLRREQLCELLWEIPDDPRGSLRWSLSKIRKLVDDEAQPRIIADRSSVRFDTARVDLDVEKLHSIADNGLDAASTDDLVTAADCYSGAFLQGLDLPNYNDFYTWCIGQREHANRSQAALLRTLTERLQADPDSALEYAQRLVQLVPLEEPARASLIRLLLALGRDEEARQQYRAGLEKLREADLDSDGTLGEALRSGGRSALPESTVPPTGLPHANRDQTLVGRDREAALLRSLVTALPDSRTARAVLLRGEPGMGKTRLLQATAALAREVGAGILKASAFESDRIRPFATWNDALRRAQPDNPVSTLLGSGERVSRDQVFSGLSDLVQEFTVEKPLVVLFDDVHWCDESSAAAMHHVLQMNRKRPVLVVGAARDSELKSNDAAMLCIRSLRRGNMLQDLRLEPLDEADLQRLISSQVQGVDAGALSQECHGNPLLALELARAQQDGGSGNSLTELVQDRMSRLDPDTVEVLQWAALLAPRIDIQSLQRATGLDRAQIDAAVEAAELQGILHPGERGLKFSHDLICQGTYQTVSAARRQACQVCLRVVVRVARIPSSTVRPISSIETSTGAPSSILASPGVTASRV